MSRIAESHLGDQPYPLSPGAKTGGTSREAAHIISASSANVREQVWKTVAAAEPLGLTADQCAAKIDRKPGYIRPRLSELKKLGRVIKTEMRRPNESGLPASVWRIVPCPKS
jgi:hypothetical protein